MLELNMIGVTTFGAEGALRITGVCCCCDSSANLSALSMANNLSSISSCCSFAASNIVIEFFPFHSLVNLEVFFELREEELRLLCSKTVKLLMVLLLHPLGEKRL